MILTEIPGGRLDDVIERFRETLPAGSRALRVLDRIRATASVPAAPDAVAAWHAEAVAVAGRLGMRPLDEPPECAFSWDGSRVRTRTEPCVLLHEVAHFQLASPARRGVPDFGLGAGPETGRKDEADGCAMLGGLLREREEQMASLLGVLWEAALGQRAIEAFQEQNWLEGAGRASAGRFFAETLDRLAAAQMIDGGGRPLDALRTTPDAGTAVSPCRQRSAA